MTAEDMMRLITSCALCRCFDCQECKRILKINYCPKDTYEHRIYPSDLKHYISNLNDKIHERYSEEVFDFTLDEDELIDIIMDSINVLK